MLTKSYNMIGTVSDDCGEMVRTCEALKLKKLIKREEDRKGLPLVPF